MRTFLGVFLVLMVSGDEVTREGILDGSVLLPCNCSQRDSAFMWQMEKPNMMLVFKHNNTTTNFYGRYKGRAKIFPPGNNNECSLLLTNVTVEDQGKYRCSFHSQNIYQKLFVNLRISASYDVCQTADNLGKVFHCDVRGRYREAWIQWNLDGQHLTNSTTTNITHKFNLDAPTGLYRFHSTLSTKLNWTSVPTCDVKAKGTSTIIRSACTGRPDTIQGGPDNRNRHLIIIPIMLVVGLSLVLKYRWNFSQSLPRIREVETDSLC